MKPLKDDTLASAQERYKKGKFGKPGSKSAIERFAKYADELERMETTTPSLTTDTQAKQVPNKEVL